MDNKDNVDELMEIFDEINTNSNKILNNEKSDGDEDKQYIKKEELNNQLNNLKLEIEAKFTKLENNLQEIPWT